MTMDSIALGRAARYASGLLALVFLFNLLLDSGAVPLVNLEPFFGGVEQFLLLLLASALIAIQFMLANLRAEAAETPESESESQTEPPVEPTVDS